MFIWKIFWFSRICHFFRWKYAPYNSYFWVNLEFDVSDHSSTHWNMFVYIIWPTGIVQSKWSHTEKKLFSSFSMVFFFFFFFECKKVHVFVFAFSQRIQLEWPSGARLKLLQHAWYPTYHFWSPNLVSYCKSYNVLCSIYVETRWFFILSLETLK